MAALGGAGLATLIVGLVGAAATITSTLITTKQANDAADRQINYQRQINAQEAEAAAQEQQIAKDAAERSRAYGASLLASDTQLNNLLSGGYDDDDYTFGGGTILTNSLASGGVQSMFA